MKKLIFTVVFLIYAAVNLAQNFNNQRDLVVALDKDTIKIDSLSIAWGSVKILSSQNELLSDSLVIIDYVKSLLITDTLFRAQYAQIRLTYRVLPVYFPTIYRNKVQPNIQNKDEEIYFIYRPPKKDEGVFGLGRLNSGGSISRGISVGNNRDVVVNSTLNLQLSGTLTEDVQILAAISDNNIPIQPDGNTQQIQEFDKVFIRIFNQKAGLTAGDFDVSHSTGHFMRFSKKAQGGVFDFKHSPSKDDKMHIKTTTAAALAKGKFTRNTITPLEGNQGPYKLRGDNNELYIIVMAGTERVFLDGKLLKRGLDNDYIIDYNTAELTFMPRQFITKDKRIVVEFEYADKNYARSLIYAGNQLKNDKFSVNIDFFSERDLKNQSLFQELTEADKILLSQVGDSVHLALTHLIDSIGFSNEFVLYKMIDTTVAGVIYDSVFVYATHPDSAHYRLGFSNVGEGRGNYVQIQNAANGRVFKWVAPLNGVPQGAYEPVSLLVAPQKKQLLSMGASYQINKKTLASLEMAVSNSDINTFSSIDNANNNGMAWHFFIENTSGLNRNADINKWQLKSKLSHEWVQAHFKPLERYRDMEFARNWNMIDEPKVDEHLSSLSFSLYDNKANNLNYTLSTMLQDTLFNGIQNMLSVNVKHRGFFLNQNGFLTTTQSPLFASQFIKNSTTIGKQIHFFVLGFKNELEDKRFFIEKTDSLSTRSQKFEQFEVFIQNPDTTNYSYNIFYRIRHDFFVPDKSFDMASRADEAGSSFAFNTKNNNRIRLFTAYRKLYRINDALMQQGIKADNNVVGRFEYFGQLFKGLIVLNTFYEIGTALEVKKEFTYVEVQAGQGLYAWTDYNGNGIKELDEFEIALFQDQANYIRVFTPTNDYVKAYATQFNQIINLQPYALWHNKKGVKKFLSRFSNRSFFNVNKKTLTDDMSVFNPLLYNVNDSAILTTTASLRNNFSLNATHPVWGIDYNFTDNKSKILMLNGIDARTFQTNTMSFRWAFIRNFFFNSTIGLGNKTNTSEFFTNRNYHLEIFDIEPSLSYQKGSKLRYTISYKFEEKTNILSAIKEKSMAYTLNNEMRYSQINTGSVNLKISYVNIRYNAVDNTPLAYEILNGLKQGHNALWQVMFQRNLKNNMQLSLLYDGRKPQGLKTIHFGSVQLRAYF